MTGVKVGILCCRSTAARWRAVASGLGQFETLVVVVETAETTLLGVVTAAMAEGVLGVRPAQPVMTAASRRHPIPGNRGDDTSGGTDGMARERGGGGVS